MSRMEQTQWKEPVRDVHIGIYGWRKRCLFLILLILLFVVALNLTLVFWFIKVLHVNANGMKYMQMVGSGIQLTGKTYIEDTLVASGFFTRPGQWISIQGAKNLTLKVTDRAGDTASNIQLDEKMLEIYTPSFKVTGARGQTMFSVDKDTVSLTANPLAISGDGGAVLEGSLQTTVVSADVRSDLVLEAANKGVQAVTPAGVSIESRAGDIVAYTHQDIKLITVDGSIKLESGNVLMPTLSYSVPVYKRHHHTETVYQLCICGSGEMFLAESDGLCEGDHSNKLCPTG